jgi:hypothetical protein
MFSQPSAGCFEGAVLKLKAGSPLLGAAPAFFVIMRQSRNNCGVQKLGDDE